MNDHGNLQKLSFLQLVGKKVTALGEISILEMEPQSWSVEVKKFSDGIETSSESETFQTESAKESGLSKLLETFSIENDWFEYKPRHFGGDLTLRINKNHSDFVEITVLDDASEKSNIATRTFSDGVETHREVLSFPNDSKREAAKRELREKYSHANGWFLYSGHGWDALPEKTSVPIITSYVRFVGVFEDDYEFLDVSNRNEAKGRAEIEFADYSVIDSAENQFFGFGNWETQTKAVKDGDGSTYMQAYVKAYWWSAYYPVDAVCQDEAEQLFLNENSSRFAVVGAWDPDEFIEFDELQPQGTGIVPSATLPSDLERKLEAIEKRASSEELRIVDLEWIFFGAVNYQQQVFGGTLPAIDYGDDGIEYYQKWGRPNFGTEVGLYWPPNQVLNKRDEAFLLDLFLRYRLLWNGDPVYSDSLSLEIGVHFELPSLTLSNFREALVEKVETQAWGQHSFLAGETLRLLQGELAFKGLQVRAQFCSECGTKFAGEEAKFCSNCGKAR